MADLGLNYSPFPADGLSVSIDNFQPPKSARPGPSRFYEYLQRFAQWLKEEYQLSYYAHTRWKAEKGDAMAEFVLATMCENGQGVFQAPSEATKWYQRAAFQGVAPAQLAIGLRYLHGHGLKQSDEEAFLWFRKAAEQGEAQAQYELGLLFSTGRGTAKDLVQARKWLCKAAEGGYLPAKQALEGLTIVECQFGSSTELEKLAA